MKTPDEIKKGLELCYDDINCSECPYLGECFDNDEEPFGAVLPDALAYIQQLETDNAELLTKNQQLETKCYQLERERYVAVLGLRGNCAYCKHNHYDSEECRDCDVYANNWEWRGVKEE